mgnify:CR=1 FL=1
MRWPLATLGLLAALLTLLLDGRTGGAVFGHFVVDGFSRFVRGMVLGAGVLLTLVSAPYTARMDRGHGEFYAILLFALVVRAWLARTSTMENMDPDAAHFLNIARSFATGHGFTNPAAKEYLGQVHVLDIGAPRVLVEAIMRENPPPTTA